MKIPNHLDEEALQNLIAMQKQRAWDMEAAIDWQQGIDLTKPLLPLDANNLGFGDQLNSQQRLVLSQLIGLIVASTISEMEKIFIRLRSVNCEPLLKRYAVNPELMELASEFFSEEAKHAQVFERYIETFAQKLDIDPADLNKILPKVRPGLIEKKLRRQAEKGGLVLWWILATVEEEAMLIFRQMKPHQSKIDPLYFQIHQRHFEEEARHAPFGFFVLKMCFQNQSSVFQKLKWQKDFMLSEAFKVAWMSLELSRLSEVKKLTSQHVFFKTLAEMLPLLKQGSVVQKMTNLLCQTPYISSFLNARFHPHISEMAEQVSAWSLPLPKPRLESLNF